jgi:hypothetical protein
LIVNELERLLGTFTIIEVVYSFLKISICTDKGKEIVPVTTDPETPKIQLMLLATQIRLSLFSYQKEIQIALET